MLKIISGGQTGVDRAALDAALVFGAPCGGWCPRGRRAEDGVLDDCYPLTETASDGYVDRTHRNVADADATLIISRCPLSGGTKMTVDFARKLHKPVYVIDPDVSFQVDDIIKWIRNGRFEILNVAGPRESKQPGVYETTVAVMTKILERLSVEP